MGLSMSGDENPLAGKTLEFWKMNGSGNDFILIDNRQGIVKQKEMDLLVKKACRRRESVGADGVIIVAPSHRYDFKWHFFNSDGGEVEMCGNGGRCVSRFAFLKGIAGRHLTFETSAGPVSAEVKGRRVRVLMPNPTGFTSDLDLEYLEGWEKAYFVNTGVPHVVVRVKDLRNHPVKEQGEAIRSHPLFAPAGTNANFMKVAGPDELEIRTFERGVEDETLACGTGAIACALTASFSGDAKSPVTARTRGGEELTIHFQKEGDAFTEVWLEGSTTIVYKGQLNKEALE